MNPPASARSTSLARRLYAWAGVYIAFWTVLGLMASTQIYLHAQMFREPRPWSRALAIGMVDMYGWGAVAMVALLAKQDAPSQSDWWFSRRSSTAFQSPNLDTPLQPVSRDLL